MATTSLTIEQSDSKRIERLAPGASKKEYITAALDYFEKYGINPLVHESPAQEMQKLIARIESILKFFRKQETETWKPLANAVYANEQRIKLDLASLPKIADFKAEIRDITLAIERLEKGIKSTNSSLNSRYIDVLQSVAKANYEAINHVARFLDAKEKTGLIGDIAKTYAKLNQ